MAKIVYGLSGQGFGHSARSKEIINHLIKRGHTVLVFTYGQGIFLLGKDFNVYEIPGLGLYYKNNKLIYWRTVCQNLIKIVNQGRSWGKISRKFKEFKPDLVFTDFEPLTAILAKTNLLPLISIDNQHQLTNTKIHCPWRFRHDFMADKLVIKSMVWGAKYYLVTTFYKTKATNKKTFIFPPIVRSEVLNLVPKKGEYILVYQTSNFESLSKELKKIDQKFIIFGRKIDKIDGNLEFKNFDTDNWLRYLSGCKAVVGNAGLSLLSECLYLKKPYMAIPIKQQVEQVINGYYLEKMGYGICVNKFNKKDFDVFISNLNKYENNLKKYKYNSNKEIFLKVDQIIKELA